MKKLIRVSCVAMVCILMAISIVPAQASPLPTQIYTYNGITNGDNKMVVVCTLIADPTGPSASTYMYACSATFVTSIAVALTGLYYNASTETNVPESNSASNHQSLNVSTSISGHTYSTFKSDHALTSPKNCYGTFSTSILGDP